MTLIEPTKTHKDSRGTVFEPLSGTELAGQKNVHVVLTQPDEVRGNHAHLTAVETTSVVGPCLVRLKEGADIRDVVVPAFRNIGDAVMVLVSFSTNLHDPGGSDTRREVILD